MGTQGHTKRRFLSRLSIIFVLLVFFAWVGDSIIATRTEARISRHLKELGNLDVTPSVYLGGIPYSKGFITKELETLSITISDIELPNYGLVTTNTTVTDLEVENAQLLNGEFADDRAQLITQTIGLDAVALGRQLAIEDLDISNAYDISPAGNNAAEVQLRGTLVENEQPVTVQANLRLRGKQFYLRPTEVLDRADSSLNNATILDKFSWSFDTTQLMGTRQASYVYVKGGTIFFEAQERNVQVHWEDFLPFRTQT